MFLHPEWFQVRPNVNSFRVFPPLREKLSDSPGMPSVFDSTATNRALRVDCAGRAEVNGGKTLGCSVLPTGYRRARRRFIIAPTYTQSLAFTASYVLTLRIDCTCIAESDRLPRARVRPDRDESVMASAHVFAAFARPHVVSALLCMTARLAKCFLCFGGTTSP